MKALVVSFKFFPIFVYRLPKIMSKGKLFLIPTVLAENTADKVISPQVKETVKNLSYFLVENQEGLGVYNTDGSPLIPCAYQRIVRLDDGTFQLTNASGLSYYLPIENKIVQLQP